MAFLKKKFLKNTKSWNSLLLDFQNFLLKFFWTLKSIITWSIFEWKLSFSYRWNPLEKVVFIFNKNKAVHRRKRVLTKVVKTLTVHNFFFIYRVVKKSLWCYLQEMFLRNSKIFFDVVFLSIHSHLLKKLELSKLCRKKVMGL